MTENIVTRRSVLKAVAAAPFVYRAHAANASPNETVLHASIGASGMALADIRSLSAGKHLKLVAVAEVDLPRAAEVKKLFPDVKVYQDWRELLDKEKGLNSINISTPDHMHAPVTMAAIQRGLNVYTQKPLTQTIYEARKLTEAAKAKKIVSQMGIQIHSHVVHRTIVATIHAGAIGKVREVHTWSGKFWGDDKPKPKRVDKVPEGLNWDAWLGVAPETDYLSGYYHPGNWRKRLNFGTGTFGDMGCHILDPVYGALELTSPESVRSFGGKPVGESWGIDSKVRYIFPGTKQTTSFLTLYWYDGNARPPAEIKELIGKRPFSDQGSIFIGTKGVLYAPYIAPPILLPEKDFSGYKMPEPGGNDHYLQFVEAVRGNGKTSAPFEYSGPLTETVLLGCLATRFPGTTLDWDTKAIKVTNVAEANAFVKRTYRKGWEVAGF